MCISQKKAEEMEVDEEEEEEDEEEEEEKEEVPTKKKAKRVEKKKIPKPAFVLPQALPAVSSMSKERKEMFALSG
jgi:hypothetical protein